jgi:hypothetical protein
MFAFKKIKNKNSVVVHLNEMYRERLCTYSSVPLHAIGVASHEKQLPLCRFDDCLID